LKWPLFLGTAQRGDLREIAMNDAGSITMMMWPLDRLKVIQQVVDRNLKPVQAAGRLGLTVR
jgi:hypothetical protein